MDEAIAAYALRCIGGYLLQMVPCAVLCLLPFGARLKRSREQAALLVVAALVPACAAFSLVGAVPLGAWEGARLFLLNLVFIVLLVPLLALVWWAVDAGRACKTFVFLLAMVYGCFVMMVQGALYVPLGIQDGLETHMYAPDQLAVLTIVSVCSFPLGALVATRLVRPQIDADPSSSRWWGLCLVPIVILVLLVGGYWLPDACGMSDETRLTVFAGAAVASAIVLCAYHVLSSRKLVYARNEQEALALQARELEREREALTSHVRQLYRVREGLANRVEQLEREKQTVKKRASDGFAPTGAVKVTLKAPGAVVSFFPREALYLEVLDHTLVIHLVGGREERIAYGLAKARELLPAGTFVQCHRSFLVNREAVRALRRYEAELVDGTRVPVSKQRYREVEAALG